MTFADFILQHEADDPVRLLLARDRYPDIDVDLAVTTLQVRRSLRTKVPEWYAVPSLQYPSRLSGEQCSSSETARYKASVVRSLCPKTYPLKPPSLCSGPSHRLRPSGRMRAPVLPIQSLRVPPSYAAEGGHRFPGVCLRT